MDVISDMNDTRIMATKAVNIPDYDYKPAG